MSKINRWVMVALLMGTMIIAGGSMATAAVSYAQYDAAQLRVDSISFNYPGSGSVTIYDNVSGYNIEAPEYVAGGIVKPAAWIMGDPYSVQVNFSAGPGVYSAQIWAENGLGGLNSSGSPVTVYFSGGTGQATFDVNSVPAAVGKHLFNWDWKYKNVEIFIQTQQTPITIYPDPRIMETTGEHILYTVLDTPQVPQAIPWLEVLDIACNLAGGRTTAIEAARDIWDDFYYFSGGLYDTVSGAGRYTGATYSSFNLTKWLTNYSVKNIGVVNCYDMGKSVVVFANALGCGTYYTFVNPFGYLNCINAIGRGWTNNPFYDSKYCNPNPIVDGDSYRCGFGNHGFTRLAGYILDGSGGQVDVDAYPDYGPPFTARELNGNDTWTSSYRDRVIDDYPPSNPGTPTNYSFSVY